MEKRTLKNRKIAFFFMPFLFAVWILVKLGDFGIDSGLFIWALIRKFIVGSFQAISYPFKKISQIKINLPKFSLPKPKVKIKKQIVFSKKVEPIKQKRSFSFNFRIPTFRLFKHKGRPRKKPLIQVLYKRNKKFLNRVFPSPIRVAVLLGVFLVIFFAYSLGLIVIAHSLPSPQSITKIDSPVTTEFYDRNGELLYRLYEGKNRTPVELKDLPDYLVKATIAMEDKNFYSHPGVDIYGIARAAISIVQQKQVQQGGSTITQQLIKNTLLTPDRTIQRKVKEILLAFWAERIFNKQEILTMYFNEVPYGGPAWGVYAGAETYFNKEPKQLDLAEAAYLAGLPASPSTYSPYGTNPGLAKLRQKEVLRRMREDGYITPEQEALAYEEQLEIKSPISQIKAPHFVMYVRSLLAQKYGEKMVSQGGLKVYTTLDMKTQKMSEEIVAEEVSKLGSLNVSNGAAMVTDAKTGQILAMVGSKSYWDPDGGNYNVTTALRQPGSSIKPITYSTGFKMGYAPGNTLLDTPVSFKNAWETYAPVNYDGKFHGPVTIRTALGSSYNIPAVKMLAIVGIPNMIQTAKDLGITTFDSPDRYGLSLTLGGGEVKLVDMMSVYGAFSQMGVKHQVEPILKLTDSKGVVLEDNSNPDGVRAIPQGVAYMISDVLSDNKARTPAFGPNSLLNIPGHTVAVKTGTTDSKRDNWTFGYTPEVVVGVWVGNNNNAPMNPALTSGVTGAAPIWNKIMAGVLQDRPNLAFVRPADIKDGLVDGHKDLVLNGVTSKSVIGQASVKVTDDKDSSKQKDVITFTDPFSTFQTDRNPPTPPNP